MSSAAQKQPLVARVFWFGVGGLISTALNAGPFKLLHATTTLPSWGAYAISLSFVTLLFAFWNYHINFITQHAWRSCFVRYIACVLGCAVINYSLAMPLITRWEKLWLPIIAGVQIGMGGIKFLLYHFWVYPRTTPQHSAGKGPTAPASRPLHMTTGQNRLLKNLLFWLLLLAAVFGIRLYLFGLLPTYLWSKDAGSYVGSAFRWLETGAWETDPRRGPVYSMFVAGCVKLWGDINAVMVVQHLLGAVSVLMAAAVLKRMHKGASHMGLLLCSYALAVNGGILHLEHTIRNETLLLFFATVAMSCWWAALHSAQRRWLLLSGSATALLTLTKNIFAPFPLVVVAFTLWQYRNSLPVALARVCFFLVGLGIPFMAATLVKPKTTEPQQGFLLYARVAQFTLLDGGIEPEIKNLISADIQSYRKLPKLDNNLILKRTAIPKITRHLAQHGQTVADANRLCMRLALEAIRSNPISYAQQVVKDFKDLLFKNAKRINKPDIEDVVTNLDLLSKEDETSTRNRWLRLPQSIFFTEAAKPKEHFKLYHLITGSSWMFLTAPVFLTTLLIPLWIWRSTGVERFWWLGLGALWWFTLVLLSTVGRPLDRYLLPVLPIMFWTISEAIISLWELVTGYFLPASPQQPCRARGDTNSKSH